MALFSADPPFSSAPEKVAPTSVGINEISPAEGWIRDRYGFLHSGGLKYGLHRAGLIIHLRSGMNLSGRPLCMTRNSVK